MALFLRNACSDRIIIVSLQCVFHSIRFKVNKGLGPSGDPFFFVIKSSDGIKKSASSALLFLLRGRGSSEQTSVVFHQLSDYEENVDGRHTVGNESGDVFSFRIAFALDKRLVPQRTELGVVLLQLIE